MLFHRGLEDGRYSTHFSREAQTDDQGRYKFASLLPGSYFIAVAARPWYAHSSLELTTQSEAMASSQVIENMKRLDVAFPLTFYSGATSEIDATGITVRNGDRTSADIALHSMPSASVTVKASGQKNGQIPFVRLSQQVFGDFEIPSQFQQRGAYPTLGADGTPTSSADMFLTGIAPGTYLAHITLPGAESDRVQPIEVSGDTVIDPESMAPTGSASIHGIVQMNGSAAPPHDAVIVIRNHNTSQTTASRVDEKGAFDFADLRPGTYEVSIANANNTFLLEMAATNAKVNGRAVTITGSSHADLAIVLGKGMGEIHGVALRDDKGLGGTMVLLVPANADFNSVLFRRDQSDSDGTFALSQIVPGHYSVVAIDDGWDLEWSRSEVLKPYLAKAAKIDVAANGKYDIKVQVQPK